MCPTPSMKIYRPTKCNICGGKVVLKRVDKSKCKSGYIYKCLKCGATVGTFEKDTDIAMGNLADKETAQMRKVVHRLLDRFWKNNLQRKQVYQKLATELEIAESECHVAYMDKDQLIKAEQILLRWLREKFDI